MRQLEPRRIVFTAIFALVIGTLTAITSHQLNVFNTNTDYSKTNLPTTLPDFHYKDLEGMVHYGSEWRDQILVLNFWATWCPPCKKETQTFIELQEQFGDKGVQFVGIAIDDPESVQKFVGDHGVNYPILLGDMGAVELSRKMGNRFDGLPFTLVAKPREGIVLRHLGELTREKLEPLLSKLTSQT